MLGSLHGPCGQFPPLFKILVKVKWTVEKKVNLTQEKEVLSQASGGPCSVWRMKGTQEALAEDHVT